MNNQSDELLTQAAIEGLSQGDNGRLLNEFITAGQGVDLAMVARFSRMVSALGRCATVLDARFATSAFIRLKVSMQYFLNSLKPGGDAVGGVMNVERSISQLEQQLTEAKLHDMIYAKDVPQQAPEVQADGQE